MWVVVVVLLLVVVTGGKQSQLLLRPTKVELGLQVGVEFDNNILSQIFFLVQHKQIRHRVSANSPRKLEGVASDLGPMLEHPLKIIAKLG